MEATIAALILAVAVAAVVAGIRAARRRAEAQTQRLLVRGFAPCESEPLQDIVRRLQSSEQLEVRKAWTRSGSGGPIHWVVVVQAQGDGPVNASDEFLCTLRRRSREPFVLYLKPVPMGRGFRSSLIENFLDFIMPNHLEKVELGNGAHAESLLAAFCPKGMVLSEVIDDELLHLLAQGAQHGIYAIRAEGEHCSFEQLGAHAAKSLGPVSWEDTCAFVERIAAWTAPCAAVHTAMAGRV